MTPRISLITALAAAALTLCVPAAWGDDWYADRQQESVQVSPDLIDRAVAAKQHRLATMLDARERSFGAKQVSSSTPMLDARERALVEKREVQLGSGVYPDAIERAVQTQSQTRAPLVADFDRFRIDPSTNPVQVTATGTGSSGREIEWPQIGIGLGIGIVLILGLLLALRSTRTRPLAH